jgi:hypothetical protein
MADIARPDLNGLRQRDRFEFRALLLALTVVFLPIAVAGRLMPRAWRPFRSDRKSVFGEAREAANTLAPFAFMR